LFFTRKFFIFERIKVPKSILNREIHHKQAFKITLSPSFEQYKRKVLFCKAWEGKNQNFLFFGLF